MHNTSKQAEEVRVDVGVVVVVMWRRRRAWDSACEVRRNVVQADGPTRSEGQTFEKETATTVCAVTRGLTVRARAVRACVRHLNE